MYKITSEEAFDAIGRPIKVNLGHAITCPAVTLISATDGRLKCWLLLKLSSTVFKYSVFDNRKQSSGSDDELIQRLSLN